MIITPWNYQTFKMSSPMGTHYRRATCHEVNCHAYMNGWALQIEELSEEDLYTATHAGKRFRRVHFGPGVNFLMFEAGQLCFLADTHRIKLDRPQNFFTCKGDRTVFRHQDARAMRDVDWMDDLLTKTDAIITRRKRMGLDNG